MVTIGISEALGIRYNREADKVLNAVLRRIGFDKVFATGAGTDVCITEITGQLCEKIEKKSKNPVFISSCPAWVKYAEQFIPSLIPQLSTVKSPQQITGVLVKTLVASQLGVRPEQVFSVSASPCVAMKFESRRDGMMRKGISDVDAVLTVRELIRLIRLYGIDTSNIEHEQADEPLAMRSSAALLAEVSGGMAEAVLRSFHYLKLRKEAEKQIFKKLRSGGSFREATISVGDIEISVAIVDGLTGLEKLKAATASGRNYDLVEVMACQGGCARGAGLPFSSSKEEIKNRPKLIYSADDTEAISLPCKSPAMINLYDKLLLEDSEIADKKIFYTHFEQRNVLL
jgi:iron only hydrogenase large subunit-like protein